MAEKLSPAAGERCSAHTVMPGTHLGSLCNTKMTAALCHRYREGGWARARLDGRCNSLSLGQVELEGLTGHIEFNSKGQRSNYALKILQHTRGGFRQVREVV